jgi:hypothetical protein
MMDQKMSYVHDFASLDFATMSFLDTLGDGGENTGVDPKVAYASSNDTKYAVPSLSKKPPTLGMGLLNARWVVLVIMRSFSLTCPQCSVGKRHGINVYQKTHRCR